MNKPLIITALFLLMSGVSIAQVGVASGISWDMNNGFTFKQVPLSLSYLPGEGKTVSFVLEITHAFPVAMHSTDIAYTTDASLPETTYPRKTIRSSWTSFLAGMRFSLLHQENSSFFIDFFPLAVTAERFNVSYQHYDQQNYEILNPDTDTAKTGLSAELGVGYSRQLHNKNRFYVALNLQSPLLVINLKRSYHESFRYAAPMQFTAGYLFYFKKNKHEN